MVEDISESDRASSRVGQSEERLRLALEATSDGVWDIDVSAEKIVWGEGCYEMLGYETGEFRPESETYRMLIHPEDLDAVVDAYRRHAAGESPRYRAEFRARHKAGHWVWVLSRGRAVEWGADGTPTRMVGTHTDISEQRKAERDLRESEKRHRLLVEHSGEGVAMTDLDERVTYANPAACRIFGVTQDELIGSTLLEYIPEDQHDFIREQTGRRARGESSTYEHDLRRGDGELRRILVTVTPHFDDTGRVVGTFGVFRDVTEEREAEEERRRVEARLAQAQRLEGLSSMAAGVAHDFSNVLMGVLGNTALALARLSDESPVRPYLEHVQEAARDAGDLAKQMLAYSGGGTVPLEPVDVSEVVEGVGHLLESIVPDEVDLRLESASGLPLIHGDPGQLSQVVVNLVSNAAEAIEGGGGRITVRTAVVTLREADWARSQVQPEPLPTHCVALDVSDTGSGIDPKILGRIFDPFFTTRITGRGLGLAATLGIVRGHGGGIWVTSEPGAGTTVRVALPCSEEPSSGPCDPEQAGAEVGRKLVLVADDQLNVRLVLSTWLEATDEFAVVTASDGDAALAAVNERPEAFDLIVMDLSMPRMDGSEAMERIRAMRPDVPIILCSGYGERTVKAKLRGEGPTAFVQKPFEPQVMVELIQGILSQDDPPPATNSGE
jgi:PAS domain S-box-containing protein